MFILGSLTSCVASTAAACACSACACVTKEAMHRSARLANCVLFSFSMVLAWILRDFAKPLLAKIPWIVKSFNHGEMPSDEWFGAQAVYRVSLGNFLLFGILAVVMCGVRFRSDWRDRSLHHGGWLPKIALWLGFNALPFFLPTTLVGAYATLARYGSPLFLLVQMVILVDGCSAWNDAWVEAGELDERFLYALLGATLAAYAGVATLAALSFHWFVPGDADCSFNTTLIVLALVLAVVVSAASLHPAARRGSLFPSAAVSLYISYLAYSALTSEPRDYECNRLGQRLSASGGATLAGGALVTLLSVVYSAFRAGSNTHTFAWQDSDDDALPATQDRRPLLDRGGGGGGGDDGDEEHAAPRGEAGMSREAAPHLRADVAEAEAAVPYSYAQFYTIFALAAMYLAMLMTGWGSGITARGLIDVGWTSVWVKCVTQWTAAAVYLWTLAAPALLTDRVFD